MKRLIFTIFAVLLLLVAVGCSKNQDAQADQQKKAEETGEKAVLSQEGDLSQKTFPIRNENNPFVTLVTDFGNMTLELYRDVAPAHADSFLARTKDGFYDGTIFHRIIQNFMIQGGDPLGNGTGNAGYYLTAEFNDLPHQDGTLSMARGRNPNSASCQFFICLARNQSTASLDKQYTVFGQLIKGYDVLHKIGAVECIPNPVNPREVSKPKEDVYLRKVYVSDFEGNEIK